MGAAAVLSDACPACDAREIRPIFVKGERAFGRCPRCDLERQYPIPGAAELRAYYERNYRGEGRLRAMFAAEAMIGVRASHRLREVRPYLAAGRWLDVGASGGAFVAAARAAGVDAVGIELAQGAVDQARELGRPVTRASIEDHAATTEGPAYDAITAFDVLEHVPDPRSFVAAARRLLRPGGTLALTVPNQRAWSRRLMGRHWYFYIPDGHLYCFNARNLQMLLARETFEVVKVASTWKPITYRYALSQLQVLNPRVDAALRPLQAMMPSRMADAALSLPLGEILMVAKLGS